MPTNKKVTPLFSLLLIAIPGAHAANRLSLTAAANSSSGTYGSAATTDIWSTPLTAAYQTDRWLFTVAVPYIHVRGAGNVIPGTGLVTNDNPLGRGLDSLLGGGSAPRPGTGATKQSSSAAGPGDVVASAGYTIVSSTDHSFGLALTGAVKFGTADADKGLGTGQNDYGLSVDTYKVLGQWTPFGGIGWTNYGSSSYIKLDSGLSTNAGVDYRIASSDSVGTLYYYRERIAVGGAAQSQYTAYWNHDFSDKLRLQGYALAGTTDASPDWGLGASLKVNF